VYEPAKYRIVFYVEYSEGLELRDERAPPSTPLLARQKGEMTMLHFQAIIRTHIWTTSQTITANQSPGTSEIEQSNSKKFPSGV